MKLRILLLGIVLFTSNISTNASTLFHAGNDVFYRWIDDSTYEFTVSIYDHWLLSSPIPPSLSVRAIAKSIGHDSTFTLLLMPIAGPGFPPGRIKNMFNCNDTSLLWVAEYIYRGTWTSPKRAKDWLFSTNQCCLRWVPPMPMNVASFPYSWSFIFTECGLNNLDFPDTLHKNNSLLFHNRQPNHPGYLTDTIYNPPIYSACVGRNIQLSQEVRNYDGESVRYEFIHPKIAYTGSPIYYVPLTYINGYSQSDPIPSRGKPIQLDSTNGMLSFIPDSTSGSGLYYLSIKASEYRMDSSTMALKEIGFVTRNILFMIEDSASCTDLDYSFQDTILHVDTSYIELKCDDNPFAIALSSKVQCSSIDSNGSHILILDATTLDTINVVKAYSTECKTYNITRKFSIYLDSALSPGLYYLMIVKGDDGNSLITECVSELEPLQDTLVIHVETGPPYGVLQSLSTNYQSDTLGLQCFDNEFTVHLSQKAFCASIDTNGSCFKLTDLSVFPPQNVAINGATSSAFCSLYPFFQQYTKNIKISTVRLDPGFYRLELVKGDDGNSVYDKCFHNWDTSQLILHVEDLSVDLGPDFEYCTYSNFDTIIDAGQGYTHYNWSTGSNKRTISVDTAGIYWVEVFKYSGCIKTDTIEVSEKVCGIGYDESSFNESIEIYPNPTDGNLIVDLGRDVSEVTFELVSLQGQILETWSLSHARRVELKMPITKGFCILNVSIEDKKYVFKVLKK